MRTISNSTRSDGNSETSGEDRDLTTSFTGEDEFNQIIKRAESIPLVKIFKYYKINIDSFNRKISCPFPKHKGGRESTPSLYYYPETNTFWCFGCKSGTTGVDFVANIEKANKLQSALKLNNLFNSDANEYYNSQINSVNYNEKTELLFSFSKIMQQKILENDPSISSIEEIYKIFDKMNDKYELDEHAIKALIDKLTPRLEII